MEESFGDDNEEMDEDVSQLTTSNMGSQARGNSRQKAKGTRSARQRIAIPDEEDEEMVEEKPIRNRRAREVAANARQ